VNAGGGRQEEGRQAGVFVAEKVKGPCLDGSGLVDGLGIHARIVLASAKLAAG